MGLMPQQHLEELDRLAAEYWWHVHKTETVAALAARFSEKTISSYIDVGCGPGATTRQIALKLEAAGRLSPGAAVAGLDFDARLSAACRSHGVALTVADLAADAVPPLERRFEFFTALDVLEHLEDPRRLLAALKPQLTEDCVGVIAVPAFQYLFSDWDRAAGHFRRYEAAGLKSLLESAGYRVLWQSYLYSFAMLPALMRRRVLKSAEAEKNLEFPKIPSWLNASLKAVGALERAYLKVCPMPFGTTALAVVTPA
jgi:2-polyprenyl-3-methyl-5-hydroxy-6-metoxy-1,4-benzoquinol methylase